LSHISNLTFTRVIQLGLSPTDGMGCVHAYHIHQSKDYEFLKYNMHNKENVQYDGN
jgi:hypothetical protein